MQAQISKTATLADIVRSQKVYQALNDGYDFNDAPTPEDFEVYMRTTGQPPRGPNKDIIEGVWAARKKGRSVTDESLRLSSAWRERQKDVQWARSLIGSWKTETGTLKADYDLGAGATMTIFEVPPSQLDYEKFVRRCEQILGGA